LEGNDFFHIFILQPLSFFFISYVHLPSSLLSPLFISLPFLVLQNVYLCRLCISEASCIKEKHPVSFLYSSDHGQKQQANLMACSVMVEAGTCFNFHAE
jgi:hypothetical protein